MISEFLPGEYNPKDFLNLIKKINPYIEIIFFMKEENENLKNFLIGIGIKKIYIDNQYNTEEIISGICTINTENDLNIEIEKLKKIIEEKSIIRKEEKIFEKNQEEKVFSLNKTVAITGNYGSGKTLITTMIAKVAQKKKLKIIIIDFDIFNNSINILFNTSKYNKNYKIFDNINQCIIKINNNISIFSGIELLFNEKNKINFEKVKKLLEKLKEDYNLILIDTSSEINLKYVKTALVNVDKIIFLMEPNLIEIKKAEELLEIYLEDWEIPNYKFGLVLNKVNINSIDEEIIKKTFNIKLIGKIDFSKNYTALANDYRTNIISLGSYEKILKNIY